VRLAKFDSIVQTNQPISTDGVGVMIIYLVPQTRDLAINPSRVCGIYLILHRIGFFTPHCYQC